MFVGRVAHCSLALLPTMSVYSLFIINKSGGLIFSKVACFGCCSWKGLHKRNEPDQQRPATTGVDISRFNCDCDPDRSCQEQSGNRLRSCRHTRAPLLQNPNGFGCAFGLTRRCEVPDCLKAEHSELGSAPRRNIYPLL